MAMMLDNVPPMEQERERKMKRKEGAPNEGIAAVDAESTWIKRTKQEIKVRMSENLPPLSPRAEQSFSSPGEYYWRSITFRHVLLAPVCGSMQLLKISVQVCPNLADGRIGSPTNKQMHG